MWGAGIRLHPFIVSFADSCQQEKNSKKNKDAMTLRNIFGSQNGGGIYWSKKIRLFGLNFYVSNCRMKKRRRRDYLDSRYRWIFEELKEKLYTRQDGKCPHCGMEFEKHEMEMHHILPVGRFPELQMSIRNTMLLCHQCHQEVHMNPFKNIKMMEQKAVEMQIDLHDRYDIS